ncbi:Smr/MutS family protein [Polluticoccus soli]|uniref:Smr/MutS family protein n=1 Tax=Polluticoccus soli TaxID=3034150 RepID=UPI0023E13584|nr:Smr/MutS family protein [Flavipsychrobacter sp. JY13-12]
MTAQQKTVQPSSRSAVYEIDLHIENLVSTTKGLSNAEMLEIQLSALKQALNDAVMNRQERLMIIHGLGRGVLRDEVHKVLAETPGIERYVNEWQGKYGFGATEVFFDYL